MEGNNRRDCGILSVAVPVVTASTAHTVLCGGPSDHARLHTPSDSPSYEPSWIRRSTPRDGGPHPPAGRARRAGPRGDLHRRAGHSRPPTVGGPHPKRSLATPSQPDRGTRRPKRYLRDCRLAFLDRGWLGTRTRPGRRLDSIARAHGSTKKRPARAGPVGRAASCATVSENITPITLSSATSGASSMCRYPRSRRQAGGPSSTRLGASDRELRAVQCSGHRGIPMSRTTTPTVDTEHRLARDGTGRVRSAHCSALD